MHRASAGFAPATANDSRTVPPAAGGFVRRASRLVALVTLATPGMLLVGAGVAAAAPGLAVTKSAKPDVLQAAWYWETALQQAEPPVDPNEVPATEPSGVPDGDLAVANTDSDGSSSKLTVLAFDIGAMKAGTTVDDFTVTLTLDGSPEAGSLNTAAATPVACLPTRSWPVGSPGPMADAPAVDCSAKVAPQVDGSSYTFRIGAIAQTWVDDQNLGVAFVNDPANTTKPFQLVFSGAKTVKATARFTPPLSTGGSDSGHGTSTGSAGGSAGAGGASGAGTTGGGAPVVVPPAPVDVPLPEPTTGTVDPGPAPPPQVAGDAAGAPLVPVAKAAGAPSSPNTGFWIAGVALALLLVSAAVVLADPTVPVPAAAQTRLSRVLRERERGLDHHTVPSTLAPREV
jgi:hypothetical protein